MEHAGRSREPFDASRLFAATEAVLEAVEHYERATGKVCPFPPDLMGSPAQPAPLSEFSRAEIEEATRFLVRLGVIVVRSAA